MKYLALCLLLAAGSCQAASSRWNIYDSFYKTLPDDCECVKNFTPDERIYYKVVKGILPSY
jgi:hypothetical protein